MFFEGFNDGNIWDFLGFKHGKLKIFRCGGMHMAPAQALQSTFQRMRLGDIGSSPTVQCEPLLISSGIIQIPSSYY